MKDDDYNFAIQLGLFEPRLPEESQGTGFKRFKEACIKGKLSQSDLICYFHANLRPYILNYFKQ